MGGILDCWVCIIEKFWLSWFFISKRGMSNKQNQGACHDIWKKGLCLGVIIYSFGLKEGYCQLVFCSYHHECSDHSHYCMFFPLLFNKASRQIFIHRRVVCFIELGSYCDTPSFE